MNKRLLLGIILLILAGCAGESDEQGREIIFQEQFEASYSEAWSFTGDVEKLGIAEGELLGPTAGQAQLCVGEDDWQNYTVTAWLDHIEGSVTIYVRFADWEETYGFYVAEGVANFFTRYDQDPRTLIESVEEIGTDPVEIAISVAGPTITAEVDQDEFYSFTDNRLQSGGICFELTGDVKLDDIVVTVP